MTTELDSKTLELDAAIPKAASRIRVLSALQWPMNVEETFLTAWRAGQRQLPNVTLTPVDCASSVEELDAIVDRCDPSSPLGHLVAETARSYASAGRMLSAMGTPDFTRWSIAIYGVPDERYATQDVTAYDAALFLLEKTDELCTGFVIPKTVSNIPANQFAKRLRHAVDEFFVDDDVEVMLDPDLPAKAVAGSQRIRLRAGALYSDLDHNQLLHHEAFVHTATMLNGKRQPVVRSLGVGAPRTTRTQEGLAVVAELFTLSIDIERLRRIALRTRELKCALDGADFIEVFEHFLEAGQSEEDSFRSTQRLFRGGDVRGRTVFTKDGVYLKGLLEVDAFLRVVVRDGRPELLNRAFAGRLTLGDLVRLEPLFDAGILAPAHYVPPWARDLRTLASALTFSAFSSAISLGQVVAENFVALDDRQSALARIPK
jgi:uncharacterized protein (TIGR02421 family)